MPGPDVRLGRFFWAWEPFQLLDGLVNHKLLRVHQVRYGVDTVPYDLAWNAPLAIGTILDVRAARHTSAGPADS